MNIPKESEEQINLASWLKVNNYLSYKSPSETYTTSWNQKRKNKAEGVTKGFPDICIILKRWSLLFIELKRQKRILKSWKIWKSPSIISKEQLEWQEELNKLQNIQCEICYWFNESIKLIKELEKCI